MMRRSASLRAELERTQRELEESRRWTKSLERQLARLEKRRQALAHGITALCVRDRTFMMHFGRTNEDPDLRDVYNEFLYAYGRTCPDGHGYTRLSGPWWDDPDETAESKGKEDDQAKTTSAI
jgi:hypothetical protein